MTHKCVSMYGFLTIRSKEKKIKKANKRKKIKMTVIVPTLETMPPSPFSYFSIFRDDPNLVCMFFFSYFFLCLFIIYCFRPFRELFTFTLFMHQVATAMQGKQAVETELNRQMDALQQNMPRIVNTLNSHMSNIMTSVSSFMKSAVNKISQIQGM